MWNPKLLTLLSAALVTLFALGCGKDPNKPTTLAEQQQMATGHKPTPEELKAAMSRFKTPGQGGSSTVQTPPSDGSPKSSG